MSKFFLNIFFVIIMGLCLTVVPINIDMLDFENLSFDFTKTNEEGTTSEEDNIISVFAASIPEENYLYNPDTLDITIKSIDDLSMYPDILSDNLTIDIYKYDNLIKSSRLDSIKSDISLSSDGDINMLTMNLALDRKSHDIKTGHYIIKISSNSKDTSIFKNLEYKVTYIDDKKYIAASDDDMNKTISTIYYPDKELLWSVPVTKEVSSRKNSLIRSVLNAILEGPSPDSGLKAGQAGPFISSAFISNSILTLNTTSKELEKFGTSSAIASASLDTMINSLAHLPNVDELKFSVNAPNDSTYFHGVSIKDNFKLTEKSKVYLGFQTTNEYNYLLPIAYGFVDDIRVEDMFETLKLGTLSNSPKQGLIQTIPQNVSLINYTLEQSILTLNLSEDFLSAYNSSEDYSKLMIDSIVYSFTSYDKIDSVQILVEDKKIEAFFGRNISIPMNPKKFINPRFE